MKKLKSFFEFINEAAPAPSKPTPTVTPPPKEDEENKPTSPTTSATPPADGTTPPPADPNAVPGADGTTPPTDPNDPNAVPPAPGADPNADPAAAGATGSTPSLGGGIGAPPAGGTATGSAGTADAGGLGAPPSGSDMGGDDSGGAGLGEPLSDEGTDEAPKQGEEAEKKPEDYIPPISKFNLVLMDKAAQWQQEYPDGGGVKEMTGYEVSWKDLNKWITENNFASKKQDIAEYLMGENDDLDDDIKTKLKNAFTSKTLGDDSGKTEVEYDNDLTPYVQDINTILVDL